jgi:hypothetical protein
MLTPIPIDMPHTRFSLFRSTLNTYVPSTHNRLPQIIETMVRMLCGGDYAFAFEVVKVRVGLGEINFADHHLPTCCQRACRGL